MGPRSAGPVLDARAYADLAKPSKAVAPFTYGAVAPGLFTSVLSLMMPAHGPSQLTNVVSQRPEQ